MIEEYCRLLNENQFKVTVQRKAILTAMMNTGEVHMTAEDVFMEVKKGHPDIGIATVYRAMDLFARLEIVHKTSFDEGKYRYEFCTGDGHCHHHFICRECGSIIEVEEDLLNTLEMELERRGFKVSDHKLKLFGICPKCRME